MRAPLAEWKLSEAASRLAEEGLRLRKGVHMGRVNSRKRSLAAATMGCTSADGTYVARGPDINLPKAMRWQREIREQGVLWEPACTNTEGAEVA